MVCVGHQLLTSRSIWSLRRSHVDIRIRRCVIVRLDSLRLADCHLPTSLRSIEMLRINSHSSSLTVGHLSHLLGVRHIVVSVATLNLLEMSWLVIMKLHRLPSWSTHHPLRSRIAILSYPTRALDVSPRHILLSDIWVLDVVVCFFRLRHHCFGTGHYFLDWSGRLVFRNRSQFWCGSALFYSWIY